MARFAFRHCVPVLLMTALAACGAEQQEEETVTAPPPPPPVPPVISATDALGQFDGTVSGLALWQHPTRSFDSAVVAANGEAGLFVIPIDGTAPTGFSEGNFSGGVDVTYSDAGALIAAFNSAGDSQAQISLLTIDPESRTLLRIGDASITGDAAALCFVGTTLFRITSDGALYRHDLTIGQGDDAGSASLDEVLVTNVSATACDGGLSQLFVLTSSSRILTLPASATTAADGGPSEDAAEGARDIAVFPTSDGAERLFLIGDQTVSVAGQIIGIDDLPGPIARMASGSGNFGSIYRGGVLATLSDDNSLSLVPWLAIGNSADRPTVTISPQGEGAGVSGLVFNPSPIASDDAGPVDQPQDPLGEDLEDALDRATRPPTDPGQ